MKTAHYLFILFLFIAAPAAMAQQGYRPVIVIFNNGNVLKGTLTRSASDSRLRIQMVNGSVMFFYLNEVRSMSYDDGSRVVDIPIYRSSSQQQPQNRQPNTAQQQQQPQNRQPSTPRQQPSQSNSYNAQNNNTYINTYSQQETVRLQNYQQQQVVEPPQNFKAREFGIMAGYGFMENFKIYELGLQPVYNFNPYISWVNHAGLIFFTQEGYETSYMIRALTGIQGTFRPDGVNIGVYLNGKVGYIYSFSGELGGFNYDLEGGISLFGSTSLGVYYNNMSYEYSSVTFSMHYWGIRLGYFF